MKLLSCGHSQDLQAKGICWWVMIRLAPVLKIFFHQIRQCVISYTFS